jgi:hypothetical protein
LGVIPVISTDITCNWISFVTKSAEELVSLVTGGREVTLQESSTRFLGRSLGAPLLILISGIVLGFFQGGFWWLVPALGAARVVGVLIWLPFRKIPVLKISNHGLECDGASYAWTVVDMIGLERIKYFPDSITVKTRNGDEPKRLESTFGWNGEYLRDALNQLLVTLNSDSARAQFEKQANKTAQKRFRRPIGPDDARRQVRDLISIYYHPDCDTTTDVGDSLLEMIAMDPFAFPLDETECTGCGGAKMKEVFLENGQSLRDAIKDLQKQTPLKAQFGRMLSLSMFFIPLFAVIGLIVGLTMVPAGKNWWPLIPVGALFGFCFGILPSYLMFRSLRRRGWMW